MASEKIPLSYKGHPLRRKDNLIYYGTMAEKYIIMLQVLDTKKVDDMDVATKVSVQLQLTDPDLKSRDRVVKKSEKDSLYAAMDGFCLAGTGAERQVIARRKLKSSLRKRNGGVFLCICPKPWLQSWPPLCWWSPPWLPLLWPRMSAL